MSEVKLSREDSQKENHTSPINLPLGENDWKLECWTELKVKDRFINKRSYHASVIYNSRLYVYGGQDLNVGIYSDFNYVQLNEDLILSHWEPVTIKGPISPGPLARMSSVLLDDKWYLFGGTVSATENSSNLWCFDFTKEEWSQIRPSNNVTLPTLDSHASCVYRDDQDKNYIITFGGFVGGAVGEYWNQILIFDIENKRWKLPYNEEDGVPVLNAKGPSPRCGHSVTIHNDKMYVFGGTNGEARFNDLWVYDLVNESWESIKSKDNPPPRNGHTSVLYRDEGVLIFGGIQDITHERDDILYFSFSKNHWKILDNQYDHSRVSSKAASPERSPKSNKFDRSFRGKSFMESPGKRTSIFKDSRHSSRNDITLAPKRGYSPALSVKGRFSKMPTNNSFAMSHTDMKNTLPFSAKAAARTYQGLTKDNEEKRKKLFLAKKANFLKEFDVSDPHEIEGLVVKSPTTESMKNSIIAVNYKGQQEFLEATAAANGNSSPSKAKKKPVSFFDNILGSDFMKVKIPIQGKLNGHKPCARDGHTALVYGNRMIVFGGDRHKMSFNDVYCLNMKQLISPGERDAF